MAIIDNDTKDFIKRTEDRLRRKLLRKGYVLEKSRSRNPRNTDWGRYQIREAKTNQVVIGERWSLLAVDIVFVAMFAHADAVTRECFVQRNQRLLNLSDMRHCAAMY